MGKILYSTQTFMILLRWSKIYFEIKSHFLAVLDEPDYTNALNPIQSPNLVGSEDLIPLPSNR